MNRWIIGSLICFLAIATQAQNTRSVEAPRSPTPVYQSSKKQKKGLFTAKKKKKSVNEVAEFRAKLQKVYRQKAKEEKLAEKPRYSDPTYFGHKKPPKKRPVGKQKFCKVCKIKH